MQFTQLGLADPFVRATHASGYEIATPIQAQAIPVVLSGRDLVGCAQTGTGKTAAFTLPMLDRLTQHGNTKRKPRTLRALVLAPTRELAAQIGESLEKYGKHSPPRHTVIFGGVSQVPQVRALRNGVDVLVATPGRLIDLKQQGHIDLSKIEILVLDEADQMLDMGFLPALRRIVADVPGKRQTLMFSATMPAAIRRLANQWLKSPVSIDVTPEATPADRITQSVHMVDKNQKADLLTWFLGESPRGRTLVFSRTKHGADKIVKRLKRAGFSAAAIHGNKSQGVRTRTIAQFKGKNPPILVATDIAARGLDIRDVSHIVNYDLPDTPETYVHRVGRTARAGAAGTAVSFCSADERRLLKQIEKLMNGKIAIEKPVRGLVRTSAPVPTQTAERESSPPRSKRGHRRRKPAGRNRRRVGK